MSWGKSPRSEITIAFGAGSVILQEVVEILHFATLCSE